MFDPSKAEHVYIAIGYTNLRMGIAGLAGVIANTFHQNPQNNSLFLFCGRRKDRIKGLYGITMDIFCYTRDWSVDGISGRGMKVN